jgi:hypothetical protein
MEAAAGGQMLLGSRQFRASNISPQESTFFDKALVRFRPADAPFAASPARR